jgi:hypothetical protein
MIYGSSNSTNFLISTNSSFISQKPSFEELIQANYKINNPQLNEINKIQNVKINTDESSQDLIKKSEFSQIKILKCHFPGCEKEYSNVSRLEIHIRTHVNIFIF